MTILYSCRHDGDQYRITKFDEDLNPTSSYLCTGEACDCPAGVRPMCRHREMLPRFLARDAVGTGWMYDYDRGGWVDQRWMMEELAIENPLPEGITMVIMDNPERVVDVHNAIAEALAEPTIPAPKRASWRRF